VGTAPRIEESTFNIGVGAAPRKGVGTAPRDGEEVSDHGCGGDRCPAAKVAGWQCDRGAGRKSWAIQLFLMTGAPKTMTMIKRLLMSKRL
jgi:hypothetical protein